MSNAEFPQLDVTNGDQLTKRLEVEEGVPMSCVIQTLNEFVREVRSGNSGPHIGRGHGMVISFGSKPGRREREYAVYVYQTATSIIIRKA